MTDFKELRTWATVQQLEYIEAIEKHGSMAKASKALGYNKGRISDSLKRLKRRAALMGHSPEHDMTKIVPDGFSVRGVSTYYDQDGNKRGQWVKSSADDEQREQMMRQWLEVLSEDVTPLPKPTKAPKYCDEDLLAVYPMGDPHFGMYAWWQDAGADFDLDIAEKLTTGAIDRLVSSAPDAGTALLLNLGDMFHADNQRNQSQSGHQLDVDGRWAKVQQVGLRAKIYCIRRLREKHARVIVRINRGNHDGHSSYALALMLSCYFRDDPAVEVDLSPAPAWYFQFGSTLIGSTHGDTLKGSDLAAIMAADKPKEWGDTTHRFWYVGHVHHHDSKEYRGCIVEYFRTLAARDAWHQGQGYRSGRDMRLIVIHREHGDIERHRCDVGMISA